MTERAGSQRLRVTKAGPLSLHDVEAMYGSLIETLPAIVYVAEAQPPYATIYISPQIESLGYTLEEWLGRPDMWMSVLHPEDRERVLVQTEGAMAARRESDFVYRIVAKDGSVRWIHDRGRFVSDGEGRLICWQGVMLDLTPKKKAEEEREAVFQELQKALVEVGTLSDLLPICSYCKKVRDDQNYWQALDRYIAERSTELFSHGICPDCFRRYVEPELHRLAKGQGEPRGT